jgi:hypothetical protein
VRYLRRLIKPLWLWGEDQGMNKIGAVSPQGRGTTTSAQHFAER